MASPITGQLALTSSVQPLSPTVVGAVAFTLKAAITNAHPAYIGSANVTSGTGFRLDPGDSVGIEKNDQLGRTVYQVGISDFYAVGSANDVISWLAFPQT